MSHPGTVVLIAATALCGLHPLAGKAEQEGRAAERLRAVGARAFEELELPGMAAEVAVGGETLLAEGWGYAVADEGVAASTESLFRAGSLTVQLVALGVLKLADEGALDLDDEVGKHLAGLEFEDAKITLRHLLEHSSGLPASEDVLLGLSSEGAPTPEEILAWLPDHPLLATPGECFSPSGVETLLLGLVLERVSELPVPEFVTARILAPLDLTDTIYCADGPPLRDEAASLLELGGETVEDELLAQFFDARGLCTTAADLGRLTRAIVEREVVSDEAYGFLAEPRLLPDGTPIWTTAGFSSAPLDDYEGLSFGGGMAGCRVHAAWYAGLDLSVVVLASSEDAPVAAIERRLTRSFLGRPDPATADLQLPEEVRRIYVGGYYVGCTRYLVLDENERLWVEPPFGSRYGLLPQGEHAFVSVDDPDVRVTFAVEDDRARAFTLYDHGTETVAVRVD